MFNSGMSIPRPMKKIKRISLGWGERKLLLVLGDFFIALFGLFISILYWGSTLRFINFDMEFIRTRVPAWFFLLPLIWVILLMESRDPHQVSDWKKTVRSVATAALIGVALYLILYFTYSDPPRSYLPRRGVAGFMVTVTVLTLLWRRLYIAIFTRSNFMRRALLVGGGQTGLILLQIINQLRTKPFNLVGIIDDDPLKNGNQIEGYPVIATSKQLLEITEEREITDIIVAISGQMQGSMFQALLDAHENGVDIIRMPVAYEEILGRVPIKLLEADWILRSFVDQTRINGFYEIGKRVLDIIGGLIGSIIFVLLLPLIALIVMLDDGRPVFYTQIRSGRGGQPYRIIKFRTMRRDAEADGRPQWAKEDDERATRSGILLRKTHLDELPQFLNVLRGEMSLVGPRAERPELIELFQMHVPFYRARLLVKPGITGWAQIHYGYASTVDETVTKLEYDLYYIKHRNLWIDLTILLRTPSTVFGFRGR
jgi:exopolysaccharide biosynthesis polyprenyl glycosylphosphotransferase